MTRKINNRTSVYRAVYYSGFDWTRTKTTEFDTYKLVEKSSQHTIYLEHNKDSEMNMEFLTLKTSDVLSEKEIARLSRMCHKIMRRTRGLGIKQDLFELKEEARTIEPEVVEGDAE